MIADDLEVGRWWRSFFLDLMPILTIALLILLTTLPIGTAPSVRAGGLWPLMGITYWTLVRPRSMGLITVFFLGLMTDLATFLPLGLHAFVFVLVQTSLARQRRFLIGQGFWVLWVAFALLALLSAAMLNLMVQLLQHIAVPLVPMLWSVAFACASLPLMLWLFDRVHQLMELFDEPV
jgi:rod shape-determining protein MreD